MKTTRRPATRCLARLKAELIPFPLARRAKLVGALASQMVAADSSDVAERIFQGRAARLGHILLHQRIAEAAIARELGALKAAVRAELTFELEVADLPYTATIGRFPDGRVGEIFLNNHKSNSAAGTAARHSAIVCSIALQFGADVESIRNAVSGGSQGRASGPLGTVLDLLSRAR
jgi:Family of unknown function (DUF6074)